MRTAIVLVAVFLLSALIGISAQTLPAPKAIADPKQVASRPNAQVEPRSLTIEKLYMTRQVGQPSWSPDGKSIAFVSNMSGRNNLWVIPSDGGFPTQLTVSDQRQTGTAWSPDGKWIAYQSDYDGDEQWDIFLVSPKTGKVVNLTRTREIAETNPAWSPDGRYLAYEVKPRAASATEIDIYDMVLREIKHLTNNTPGDTGNYGPFWSKDGKSIVYTQASATTAADFLDRLSVRMPFPIRALQVDGGSEFESIFEEACSRRGIRLFVLPPRSPKLNGGVERAHRTHTEEFYEVTDSTFQLADLRPELLEWETIYNTVRPHQALGYLTPQEFLAQALSHRKEPECH